VTHVKNVKICPSPTLGDRGRVGRKKFDPL